MNAEDEAKLIKRRRRPETVRRLALEAAARMFAEYGYAGASLRTIAADAGIAESQIVRNFGTKSALFTQAVIEPISEYIDAYHADWERHLAHPYDADQLTRIFIEGLYDIFRTHRKLLMALITSNAFDSELSTQTDLGLGPALKKMEQIQSTENEREGYGVGPITIRTLIGMVIAMSVLENFLYSHSEVPPTREQMIDEMVALAVHGVFRSDIRRG